MTKDGNSEVRKIRLESPFLPIAKTARCQTPHAKIVNERGVHFFAADRGALLQFCNNNFHK